MNAQQPGQTADILAFPLAKRMAAVKLGRQAKFAAEVASLRASKVVSTDSWYHQAAIDEAGRDRGN